MYHYDPAYVFIVDQERRRRLRPDAVDPAVRSGRRPRRRQGE
jgi:hypothetical protein